MKVSQAIETAYKAALKARKNAHSPYSKFKVGAAIQWKKQSEPTVGCNIENASFGATLCAERSAVAHGISRFGKGDMEFVVVVTGEKNATAPCALCLQVLAEFAEDDLPIYLGNEDGIQKKLLLSELLPLPFRAFEKDK